MQTTCPQTVSPHKALRNVVLMLAALLWAPATWAFFSTGLLGSDEPAQAEAASATDMSGNASGLLDQPVPEVRGPKRVVSVGQFTSIGAFETKFGSWDVGGGLASMLTTALQESGRFIVVERSQLQAILTEQEMAGNNVSSGTGPELGKVLGVQLLILGAVTEFGTDDDGGGFSLGLGVGGLTDMFGDNDASAGVSRQSMTGTVALNIRVVDTTTGRVLQSFRVAEKIDNSAWDFSIGYDLVNVGTNSFIKTPLGDAARKAINSAVREIAVVANDAAWQGRVVDFDAGEIYINAGSASGIKTGDAFTIERVVKRLTDPDTNEVLMVRKEELGIVEVEQVLPKVAIGNFQALGMAQPQRGDFAVMIEN